MFLSLSRDLLCYESSSCFKNSLVIGYIQTMYMPAVFLFFLFFLFFFSVMQSVLIDFAGSYFTFWTRN